MTFQERMAYLRLFLAFFFSLLGLGMVFHGGGDSRLVLGAALAGVGLTTLFVVWISARNL
jgi:hypothetical protein